LGLSLSYEKEYCAQQIRLRRSRNDKRWKPVLHGTGPESSVFSLWGCRGWGCLQCDDSEFFFCPVAGLWNRIPSLVRLANSLFGVNLLFGQAGGRPHRYAPLFWLRAKDQKNAGLFCPFEIGATMTTFSPVIKNMKSRMNREVHVRFCGKVRVKFPGLTRLWVMHPSIGFPRNYLRKYRCNFTILASENGTHERTRFPNRQTHQLN
jgi:hypothetical protein